MLEYVRTPTGATCKFVLQLEATLIEVKTCNSTRTRAQVSGISYQRSDHALSHENTMKNKLHIKQDPGSSPGGDTCFWHQ